MTHSSAAVREQLSDREVIFSRVLDAPRELVWQVWSEPRHLHQWWGPSGFTTTTHEFSFVVGGVWRSTMHGPDGTDYPTRMVFREIVPPSRLVYDNGWDLPGAPLDFEIVCLFAAEEKKTRFSLRMTFDDADAYKRAVELYGVLEGGTQSLDRLAEYVRGLA